MLFSPSADYHCATKKNGGKHLHFYVVIRKEELQRERERDNLPFMVHSLRGCNGQGWGRPKPGALFGSPMWLQGPKHVVCLMLILRLIYSELGWLRAAGTGTRGLWMPTSQVAVLPSVPKCWPPTSVVLYQHQCQVNKLIIKILPEDFKFLSSAFKKRFESQMGREPGGGNKL